MIVLGVTTFGEDTYLEDPYFVVTPSTHTTLVRVPPTLSLLMWFTPSFPPPRSCKNTSTPSPPRPRSCLSNDVQTLAVRVGILRFCRKYFAVSLAAWKDKDAQRVAAQVSGVFLVQLVCSWTSVTPLGIVLDATKPRW